MPTDYDIPFRADNPLSFAITSTSEEMQRLTREASAARYRSGDRSPASYAKVNGRTRFGYSSSRTYSNPHLGLNSNPVHPVTKDAKYANRNPHTYDNSATSYSPTRAAYKRTRQEIGRQNKTLAGYQSQLGGSRFATIGGMAVAGGYMSSAIGGSFLAGAGGAILGGTATVAGASVAFNAMGKAMRNNAMNPQKGIVNNPATRSALKALNFMSSKGTRRIAFAGGGMAGALGAGIVTSAFSSSRNRMGGGLNNNRGNTF